ncbi:hypothetical protein WA026_005434 [Henosepilachna vigintioctopunctata]|uniref:Uncharacterized protein n=1 Tax=Henosepilachna vigintioctopunctata TaxID=420089 RepID=A0AAW1TSV5_9CUCU
MFVRSLFIVLQFVYFFQAKELPEFFQNYRCSLTKDFRNCFIEKGNKVIPVIAKGDPELHIPKMIPLELKHLQLVETPTLNLHLSDIKIYGLDEMKIRDVRLFKNYGGFSAMLEGKNLTIEGQYSVNGKILVLPIKGNGPFSLYLKNGLYKAIVTAEAYEKNGKKYFRSTGDKLEYSVENITFDLDNLFDGNKQLGDEMNRFLNENWDLLLTDFGPGIAKIVSSMHRKMFDAFTSEYAIYEIFLE